MDIKLCIFDMDGVIVDTADSHHKAWNMLANSLGFELTKEGNEKLKGVSRMESLDILLGYGNILKTDDEKDALATKKNEWYKDLISNMSPSDILPGVKNFIESLQDNGIKVAIGSSSKNAPIILKGIGMEKDFDEIIDGNKISNAKPDPEVFALSAANLGIDPSNCIVFEDAEAGIEAAKRAGMIAIGVGTDTSLSNSDILISSFNDFTIEKMKQMISQLKIDISK